MMFDNADVSIQPGPSIYDLCRFAHVQINFPQQVRLRDSIYMYKSICAIKPYRANLYPRLQWTSFSMKNNVDIYFTIYSPAKVRDLSSRIML